MLITCLAVCSLAIVWSAKASAFFHRGVYSDFARDDGFRCLSWYLGVRTVGAGCMLSDSSSVCGYWRLILRAAYVLARCHIVRHAEPAHAEELQQATALGRAGLGGGH